MAHNYRFHHGETTIGGLPQVCHKCQIYCNPYQDDPLTDIYLSELLTYLEFWTTEDILELFQYLQAGTPPKKAISTPGFQHLIKSTLFIHEMKAHLDKTGVPINNYKEGFERLKTSLVEAYSVYEYLSLVARCIC